MKRLLLPVMLLCFTLSAFAQMDDSPYFSGSFGASSGGGQNAYSQRNSPSVIFSAGFGMPVFKRLSLYTKISYISKSDYSVTENYNFADADFSSPNNMMNVNASFSQLLFNGGLQYNISLSDELILGLNGGVTYALINHDASLPNGALLQRLDNVGVFGAFSGVSLEKTFEDSNVSLFGEAQYNYAKKDITYFRDKFSGMNFTFGGRYYFNDGN